jgi:hypothetical protein
MLSRYLKIRRNILEKLSIKMILKTARDGTKLRLRASNESWIIETKPKGKWFYRFFLGYATVEEAWRNMEIILNRLNNE